jgi:hypothetical protein
VAGWSGWRRKRCGERVSTCPCGYASPGSTAAFSHRTSCRGD